MKTLTNTTIKPAQAVLGGLIALAGLVLVMAPSAGAEGLDEIIQGFEEPLAFEAPDFGVLLPTLGASVSVDCSNEDPIHVQVGNSTNFSTNIVVSIDGDDVSGLVRSTPTMLFRTTTRPSRTRLPTLLSLQEPTNWRTNYSK